MFLIESIKDGKTVRRHWQSLKASKDEAEKSIKWMEQTFGSDWSHCSRSVEQHEIDFAKRQGWCK